MLTALALALCASNLVSAGPTRAPPALNASSSPIPNGVRVPFRSRQLLGDPTGTSNSADSIIFVPDFVKRESRDLLLKYEQAEMLLKGLGLSPSVIDGTGNGLLDVSWSGSVTNVQQGAVELRDYVSSSGQDILYYGPTGVGMPVQILTVIPDTGSSDLWYPVNCQACTAKQFDPSTSVSYRSTSSSFQVAYGAGYAYGSLASDTVSIAGYAVDTQYFGAVDSEAAEFTDYPNSGVLGLAFGSISRSGKLPFFENLIKEGRVKQPLFGISLVRSDGDSELCIGCVDSDKYFGDISWFPVKSRTYWTLALTGLNLNGVNTISSGLLAAIDSGTSQIYVPMSIASAFYASIPGSARAPQYGNGFFTFPCSARASVSLSFDGVPFAVHPFDFNLGMTAKGSKDCVGGILGLEGEGLPEYFAVVGSALLKSWYAVFDYSEGGRVGFARTSSR